MLCKLATCIADHVVTDLAIYRAAIPLSFLQLFSPYFMLCIRNHIRPTSSVYFKLFYALIMT